MNILIAGAGEVGTYLAKMLSNSDHDITIIDSECEEKLKSLENHFDLLSMIENPASIKVLKEAKVAKADLFIAITPYQTMNCFLAILAKKLGAKKSVVRVDNMEYISTENKAFFKELGIDSLIYPEMLAAREISQLLNQSGTKKIFEFSGGKLSLFVIRLGKDAPIINKTLTEVAKESINFDYRVVAITRNSTTIIPNGSDIFMANDLVYVFTNKLDVDQVMKYSGQKRYDIKNIMILGGSKIGKKTAKELENQFRVKLLEGNKERSFELADFLDNTLVINNDGRNVDLLIEEGIKDTDAFIAVTGNSETNILSCLIAKRYGVKKTIAEIENIDYINLAENIGIDTIINKKLITASHIYRFTTSPDVTSVQCIAGTDAEILEFSVRQHSKVTRSELRNLRFPAGAIIGGIIREDKNIVATGNCKIITNDKVVVFALPQAIKKVTKFFK